MTSLGSTVMAVAKLSSQEGQRRVAENMLEKLHSDFKISTLSPSTTTFVENKEQHAAPPALQPCLSLPS